MAQFEHVKRVLIVHSFGSAAPPFSVHAVAFETRLTEKMGQQVDLDEVSLDMARYAAPDTQEAVVEYLEKRQVKWQPDIVVPIGSPAGVFVATYRERLFSKIPVLYCSMDRRLLPEGALENNATYIGQLFDVPNLIRDMVELAPKTKNIAVVVGATPLEQKWKQLFENAAAQYSNRIRFTYFDDLSFDQMLEKSKALPPNSFIFLLLLLRDAAGVTHNADEALQRLHAVANAPINSIFDHQMGLGVTGGRLYQSERIGTEAADMAVRILHGEAASSIQPVLVAALPPRYDSRELRRWKIDEAGLPAGSTVLFREPSFWERDKYWIIGGVTLFGLQALLISGLIANLIRRRRAEGSLVESEQRFEAMADAAPVMMWTASADKRCTFVNQAWLALTGRTLAEELGSGWRDVFHPDDLGKFLATRDAAFDVRKPFVIQYRCRRHDGEFRWLTDTGVPRYDAEGNFIGYVGVCVDITELLTKEKALHEFEERVALAAEVAHLGAWQLDTITNKIWMSDKNLELFQFERGAQISYEEFRNRIHPDDRALRDTAIARALAEQSGYEIEYRALLPDGTIRWIGARGRCMMDENGQPTRLHGVSMDITARKHAEELFRLAIEASPSGTLLVNSMGEIVLLNAHIEELFGYRRDELIGKPVKILVPERLAAEYAAMRAAYFAAPEVRAIGSEPDLYGRRKNGTEFPVEIGLSPIQMPEGTLVLANIVDVSARKAAEAAAQVQRDQIDLLSRASLLGEMAASLAHELNQPLSAIVNNANAGTRFIDKGQPDPEILREIMVDVEEDGRRAHEIINAVRQSLKKDGSGSAMRQAINLNDSIGKVVHMVQPDATAYACEIETSLANDLPPIEGNPVQIQQVLINLMSNAFDAMRETATDRRKVTIATESNGDGNVHVEVRDRGGGIPREVREQMFEHFFTTKEEGLGMGLAIVRSIVEAHGGRIGAHNREKGGACFFFTLPTSQEHLS